MEHAQNFDKQNFDKLIVGFIQETDRLVMKILMNHWPFIKMVILFHYQTSVLYDIIQLIFYCSAATILLEMTTVFRWLYTVYT